MSARRNAAPPPLVAPSTPAAPLPAQAAPTLQPLLGRPTPHEATPHEATPHEATPHEITLPDTAPPEAASLQATRPEAAPPVATHWPANHPEVAATTPVGPASSELRVPASQAPVPSPLTVGVVRERSDGESRVALAPAQVTQLRAAGLTVVAEPGAGARAWYPDDAYAAAGAELVERASVVARADVLLTVGRPDDDVLAALHSGQAVLGLLRPLDDLELAVMLGTRGVTVISLDLLPRTLSRAQPMDAVTSQANIAGYKAVLVAACAYGRFFPLLVTAAGTARPAAVLVLGAGVAGLQAIGTARRLGAVVHAFDVRAQAPAEVASVGGIFLDLDTALGGGEGGYARALTLDEQARQQEALTAAISHFDIVITTALVPGRRPPVLVTDEAVKAMAAGSVIVDLAAGPRGGNVAAVRANEMYVTENGVTIVGAGNLAATVPTAASATYSRNVTTTLLHMVHDGHLSIDTSDEIQAGIVVAHGGSIVHSAVRRLLEPAPGSDGGVA